MTHYPRADQADMSTHGQGHITKHGSKGASISVGIGGAGMTGSAPRSGAARLLVSERKGEW